MTRTSISVTLAVVLATALYVSAQRQNAGAPAAGTPCCAVTAINQRAGMVTAKINATGQTFEFTVANAQLLQSVRIGQGVFANFAGRQVSLDGRTACCQITSSPQVANPVAQRPIAPQAVPPPATSAAPARAATSAAPGSAPGAPAGSQPVSPATASAALNTNGGGRAQQGTATKQVLRPTVASSQLQPSMLNPCAAQSQTTTERTPSVKTPVDLKGASTNSSATPGSFGESICAGTPYKRTVPIAQTGSRYEQRRITATANGQTVAGTILHLRGLDGIQQAQAQGLIPKSVGDILSMHVRALPAGQSDHYLVNPDLALAWSKTHPEPSSATGKATDNHEGCNAFSMHCAGEVVEHAEGQVDQLRAQAQQEWQHMIGQAAQMYGEAASCFDESNKTLAKIPIAFDEPFQINAPLEVSESVGPLSGSINGKVGVGFPVSMKLMTDVSVFYVECLPFMIRPRGVDVDGSVTTGTNFIAQATVTGKFQKDFPIFASGPIPIEVLPIIVGGVPIAEADFSAYIAADVNVAATATAQASYQVEHTRTVNLQFSCDGGGCPTHRETQDPTQTTTTKSAEIKGQLEITPAVYTALQVDFDVDALTLRAGPKPALIAQVNGCAFSGSTTRTVGQSTSQRSECLVADLDWKTDFVSQILIATKSVASRTDTIVPKRHIRFDDLLSGGSTALIAGLSEVPNPAAGQPVFFKVQMPQCYPYADKIQYQVTWTGGGSGVPNPSTCTWDDAKSTGTCFADPSKELEIGMQWPGGNHSISVALVHDAHPRDFKVALNSVSVNVPAEGGVSESTLASKP